MCDPLTITGIALSAGSTIVQTVATNKVQNARNDALAAERIRQNSLDREADALNATSRERYVDFAGQQGQEATKLGDYFAAQSTPEPTAAEALPASSSNLVVAEENKARGAARGDTNERGAALGNLRAFGDLLGAIGRSQARDAGLVGQIGSFKQGSSGVLPYELEAANEKGAGLRFLGDLLGGAGSVITTAGLSGQSLFGKAPKVAAPAAAGSVMTAKGAAPLRLGYLYGGGLQ